MHIKIIYLEKLPVTGYEDTNEPMILAAPKIKTNCFEFHSFI